jgi:hypothetical protein
MGASESKSDVSQNVTNTTINKSVLNNLNETMMNASYNTLFTDAKNCSNSVSLNNLCKFDNIDAKGDVVIGGDQSNTAKVDFTCVQTASAKNDMSAAMLQNLASQMESVNGTSAAAALNAAASGSNNTGALTTSGGTTNSITNTNTTNKVDNQTISNIRNVFEQNLNNNFTSETVAQCIGKTELSNELSADGIRAGGNVNIKCVQQNSAEVIQQCEQLSSAINKSLSETANALGMSVVTASATEAKTEAKASTEAQNKATGVIQDTGTAVSETVTAVGGAVSGVISSTAQAAAAPLMYLCGIFFIIAVIGLLFMFLTKMGGQGSSPTNAGTTDSLGISNSASGTNLTNNYLDNFRHNADYLKNMGKNMGNNFSSFKRGGGYSISDMFQTDLSITSASYM